MQHRIHQLLALFRGDMKRLPRIIIFTIFSMAIYSFGWGFADPFFSIFLSGFSDSYALIGWFMSVFMVTSLLLMIPIGDLLDRVRHATLINAAKVLVSVIAVLYFIAGYTTSTPVLLIALCLNGLTYALIWPSSIATVRAHSTNKNAGLGLGLFFTFRQLSWALGIGCALLFIWHFPIYYIFIPTMITPLLSIACSKGEEEPQREPLRQAVKDIIFTDKLILRFFKEMKQFNAEMWWAYLTFMGAYIVNVLSLVFVPLFAESLGFSITQIGLLVIVMNIPFFLSFISAEVADHMQRIPVIIMGMIISALGIAGLALWHDQMWHVFVSGFFLVVGYSIAAPALSSIITILTPKGYSGTGTSLLECCLQLSMVIFSPLLGYSIDRHGWEWTLLSAAMVCLLVALCAVSAFVVFKKRNTLHRFNHPHTKHEPYIL